jgi:hypothetical protein
MGWGVRQWLNIGKWPNRPLGGTLVLRIRSASYRRLATRQRGAATPLKRGSYDRLVRYARELAQCGLRNITYGGFSMPIPGWLGAGPMEIERTPAYDEQVWDEE